MAKKASIKVYDNLNEMLSWELETDKEFTPLWDMYYGENPQQRAGILQTDGMADFEVMFGKTLSYNEVLSLTELANILCEFYDVCAVAIVKHAAPCGVALAPTIGEAYTKAFDCDPIASFFGSIGFTKTVTAELAKHLNSMSVKMVFAPEFEEKALEIFKVNPLIKIIKLNTPLQEFKTLLQKDIHVTPFGTLYQDANKSRLGKNSFRVVTKTKPTKEQIEDLVFAWKVSKYARSNSIVIAKDFKTAAITQGFITPVTAVEVAMNTACDAAKDAVLASDTVLPTVDCVYAAAQGRISAIIQPGGAANEDKIIELADKYNIAMILTGIKNYKH